MNGMTVASDRYHHSLTEQFPSPIQSFNIESGVLSRINRDYLPINANLDSAQINDNYIEFNLNSSDREFFNCEKIFLELQLQILKPDGTPIDDGDSVSVIDSLGSSIIAGCNVYLNSTPVESNPHFGIWNTVKSYLSMGTEDHKTHGIMNFQKHIDTECVNTVTAAYFADASISDHERKIIQSTKNIIHLFSPLKLDISSSKIFLLDNVEIRIRLDLQPANFILLTHTDIDYKYKINLAKLHVEKITPQPSALLSLNDSLRKESSFIQYMINKPSIKNHVYPRGYRNLTLDNVFNGFIPSKMILFFISQQALSGSYQRNPLYLKNCGISSIRVEIDGNVHSVNSGNFTDRYAQYLSNTLQNISSNDNMISVPNFKSGRTIFVYDLQASDSDDVLHIEKRGNIRLNIQLSHALTENVSLFAIGISTGNVYINSDRIVKTNFLL